MELIKRFGILILSIICTILLWVLVIVAVSVLFWLWELFGAGLLAIVAISVMFFMYVGFFYSTFAENWLD